MLRPFQINHHYENTLKICLSGSNWAHEAYPKAGFLHGSESQKVTRIRRMAMVSICVWADAILGCEIIDIFFTSKF